MSEDDLQGPVKAICDAVISGDDQRAIARSVDYLLACYPEHAERRSKMHRYADQLADRLCDALDSVDFRHPNPLPKPKTLTMVDNATGTKTVLDLPPEFELIADRVLFLEEENEALRRELKRVKDTSFLD